MSHYKAADALNSVGDISGTRCNLFIYNSIALTTITIKQLLSDLPKITCEFKCYFVFFNTKTAFSFVLFSQR